MRCIAVRFILGLEAWYEMADLSYDSKRQMLKVGLMLEFGLLSAYTSNVADPWLI